MKQLFTCSSGILIGKDQSVSTLRSENGLQLIRTIYYVTGDPRCTNIAIENAKLNCCEVQVAAVPHFCALMDAANLVTQ